MLIPALSAQMTRDFVLFSEGGLMEHPNSREIIPDMTKLVLTAFLLVWAGNACAQSVEKEPAAKEYKGCGERASKSGLMGSVHTACNPVSAWNRNRSMYFGLRL
jgi:hypothetical protein